MPGEDLASIIDEAMSEKLERLEARRYGKTNKPRKNVEDADTSPGVRGIPAPVKRAVWERDRGQCTYVSGDGSRCPERHKLEYHHEVPFALGGDRSVQNTRLLCKAHNLYMAEKDYGKEKMDAYRCSVDRVREPAPSFQLFPRRVPVDDSPPPHVSGSLRGASSSTLRRETWCPEPRRRPRTPIADISRHHGAQAESRSAPPRAQSTSVHATCFR